MRADVEQARQSGLKGAFGLIGKTMGKVVQQILCFRFGGVLLSDLYLPLYVKDSCETAGGTVESLNG